MARRRRIFGQVYTESEVEPLIRLWVLRILVLLNGRHRLVERVWLSDSAHAQYISSTRTFDPPSGNKNCASSNRAARILGRGLFENP